MEQIKVLFFSHKFYPDIGGIEVNSEVLAVKFKQMGCQVRLLTWTEKNGERTFPFEIVRNPSIQDLYKAHRWADIVFENNPCLRMAWPNIFVRRPLVVALRTWISRTDGQITWQEKLKIFWLNRATKVIAVSEAVRKRHWTPAIVIGNPYREENFKMLPAVNKALDMVFLGRLVSDKGVSLAIEALATLRPERREIESRFASLTLTIIGDGPDRQMLEDLAVNLGVADRVSFTGNLQGVDLVCCLNQHKI